jgi:ParB family transcriptional regulator, chromosome partitioning protein
MPEREVPDMSEKPARPRGLGRGLSALMSDLAIDSSAIAEPGQQTGRTLPVDRLQPNPDQPRRTFRDSELQDLADSLREHGVIQPIIVRPAAGQPDLYQIVAGERRWRAALLAGLDAVPVVVRDYTDLQTLEVALIENIQRSDLNPIEEATGFAALIDRFGHTQEQLGQALGKSRSHVANQLRLLTLPAEVQSLVTAGQLSAGHARALVGHPDVIALARHVATQGLSVRDTERLARKPKSPGNGMPGGRPFPAAKDPDTIQIENELSAQLGMGVTIEQSPGQEGGKLILRYKSAAQLDDLMRALTGF